MNYGDRGKDNRRNRDRVVECFLDLTLRTEGLVKDGEKLFRFLGADGDAYEVGIDGKIGELASAFLCANQVVVCQIHKGAEHGEEGAKAWALDDADAVVEVGDGKVQLDGEESAGGIRLPGKLLVVGTGFGGVGPVELADCRMTIEYIGKGKGVTVDLCNDSGVFLDFVGETLDVAWMGGFVVLADEFLEVGVEGGLWVVEDGAGKDVAFAGSVLGEAVD